MRLGGQPVDIVVVVVEPTAKSLEVGRRAAELVRESRLGRLVVSANRVRDDADEERVRSVFPGAEIHFVPEDPAIFDAERRGEAPLDASGPAPAVEALVRLAEGLVPSAATA